ncbi:MAG TPA: flavodoxin domain-containing protein [Gemmatimonadales bacterium]|jgi:menaquinone-dependent protoporphyrinogen oxidase|nr:flavodoxin domain-containing protein [Gemmatimonadales bacterium]
MSKLLILYGTTDGHTAKIARFLASEFRTFVGVSVDVVEAGTDNPDPRDYDGVIVAASVHRGGYQRRVVRWAREHARQLSGKPSAFLSVCLGVLQQDLEVQRDLVAITNRFEAQTGWKPPRIKLVAGALKYTRYGWLKRIVMSYMAAKAGGSTDMSRDHEYTDWADLREFAEAFWAMCRVIARCECGEVAAEPRVLAKAG